MVWPIMCETSYGEIVGKSMNPRGWPIKKGLLLQNRGYTNSLLVERQPGEGVNNPDRVEVRLQEPGRSLRHHVALVVVSSCREHGDLLHERFGPRGVAIEMPVPGLELRSRRVHARDLSAQRIDRDDSGNVDLQPLDHRRSIRLVLDEHRADRAMHVPLPPNLGFGGSGVQVRVDDVQKKSLPSLDADDAYSDIVGAARVLEAAIYRNQFAIECL